MRLEIIDDVIVNLSKEFSNDKEGAVKVELISKESCDYLFESNVFKTVNFFSVMVGNEGTVHFTNFELECIFNKPSSD